MTDKIKSPEAGTEGQVEMSPEGTGETPPDDQKGQAKDNSPGTELSGQAKDDSFFDPNNVPDDLKPAYKQMQAAFTKKMQSLSSAKEKVQAYDSFMQDPVGQMEQLARQYGMELKRPGQAQPDNNSNATEWQPNSWDDVFMRMEEHIMGKMQGQLKPVFDSVQKMTATNIEKQLDEIDPQWRMYEDEMKATLQAHPSLVSDIAKLYRISMPEDVLNSKAVQTALRKMEDKANAAKAHGSHGVTRSEPALKKAGSFQEAVDLAREQGKKEGWYK